jgi:hypothetical protein
VRARLGGVGATDLSRSTIPDELEGGRATAANNPFGDWQIDYREFHPIYPPPAANAGTDGARASVTPDLTLEADIAALVQEAQESLRQPENDGCGTGQNLHRQAADTGNVSRFSATSPKNIEVKVNESEPERAAWDPDIRINDAVRAIQAVSSGDTQTNRAVVALLLGLAIGWIVRSPLFFVESHPTTAVEQKSRPSGDVVGSLGTNRTATPRPGSTSKSAAPAAGILGHRRGSAQGAPQQSKSVKTSPVEQRSAGLSEPAASGFGRQPDNFPRPTPFPETKPDTIEGWTVLDVYGGTAVLDGPEGIRRGARGDYVRGLGRLESIVRWGSRWIVVTDRGLISTP